MQRLGNRYGKIIFATAISIRSRAAKFDQDQIIFTTAKSIITMIRTKSFPQRQNQYCSRQNQYWSFTRKSFPLGQNQYWSRQNHEQIIFTTWLEWHRVNSQGALGAYPTWRREKEEFNNTFSQVQRRLAELINGPCSSAGYPTIWHQLETGGLRIPIVIVQDLSKEWIRKVVNWGRNTAWRGGGIKVLGQIMLGTPTRITS